MNLKKKNLFKKLELGQDQENKIINIYNDFIIL